MDIIVINVAAPLRVISARVVANVSDKNRIRWPDNKTDYALARHGKIMFPGGVIQFIGSRRAYDMIREREESGYYYLRGKVVDELNFDLKPDGESNE